MTQRRPDFFLVGAPKCGTTAMARYLGDHPEIFMPIAKELHYFGSDLDYRRRRLTAAEYLALFDTGEGVKRVGEASVGYLYSETAPAEILEFSPEARILIMLRDPIDMIRSQHSQELFMGQEDITNLAEALRAEPDRSAGRRIPASCTMPYLLRYTWLARYAEHVERYLEAVGPGRVHVTLFDDFKRDTSSAYADVVRFLGCDASFTPEFPVVNERKRVRSVALQHVVRDPPPRVRVMLRRLLPMAARVGARKLLYGLNSRAPVPSSIEPELAARLRVDLEPDIRRLADLLGRDLSAWMSSDHLGAA